MENLCKSLILYQVKVFDNQFPNLSGDTLKIGIKLLYKIKTNQFMTLSHDPVIRF